MSVSGLPLRPDQDAAVAAVEREIAAGRTRCLVIAPMGSGKSWIIAELVARAVARGQRALVVVHREEILDQLADRVRLGVPHAWVGLEQATRRADPLSQVVVGSVPTLAARGGRRLDRLGRFDLVLCDEAHHAVADSFQRLFRRLGVFSPGGPALVGTTATGFRGDGVGLGHIFQAIAHETRLADLIAQGILPHIRAYSIETHTALDAVRQRGGDFDEDALARAVNTPARNALAVRAYEAHAAGRQAIVFAVDRQHARDLARQFQCLGHQAEPLTGDLPPEVRRARLQAFRAGALPILVNVLILTEGVHVQARGALGLAGILCRPTTSPLLWAQSVGRILQAGGASGAGRPPDVVAIDLVDTTRIHRLQTLATLAGLPPRIRFDGQRLFEVAPRLDQALSAAPWLAAAADAGRLVTVADVLRASHPVDLLYLELPLPPAFARSRLAWVAVPPARWILAAPEGTLTVRQTLLAYEVSWRARAAREPELLGAAETLEEAVALAERAARGRLAPSALRLLDRRAPWRYRPASDRQKALLDRYRIPYTPATTAGEAARALSRRFAGLTTPALARHVARQAHQEDA